MTGKIRLFWMAAGCVMLLLAGASRALSSTHGAYGTGFLIPYAVYANSADTAVGIAIYNTDPSDAIYWTYFDANGARLSSGTIPIQDNTWVYTFSLRTHDGNAHPNTLGYLVFTCDNDGSLLTTETQRNIAGWAFLLSVNDAVYIPIMPLTRADYAGSTVNLNSMVGASLIGLSAGMSAGSATDVKYWLDPTYNAQTYLIMWTVSSPGGSLTATVSNTSDGPYVDIVLPAPNTRVNSIDLSTVAGIPSNYLDGGITIDEGGGARCAFTLVVSDYFNAIQTLPGIEYEY